MRRSIGDRLRAAVRAAVHETGSSVGPSKIEERLRTREPELYAEWRRTTPEPSARLAYLAQLLAAERPRRPGVARPDSEVFLWPIGPRQRWHLRAARGAGLGAGPDPSESGLFLHNYGTSDVTEVAVSIAGLAQEFIPRVTAGETVEIEWSEERIHPSEGGVPPAEARGYPDRVRPAGDRQESQCDLKVEFSTGGRRRVLEGILFYFGGAPPTFFQQTGTVESADRARPIR